MACRLSGESIAALAGPPLAPPSLPNATAWVFFDPEDSLLFFSFLRRLATITLIPKLWGFRDTQLPSLPHHLVLYHGGIIYYFAGKGKSDLLG